jgi:ABC-type molybdate transport system substrate-binding protein
MKSYRLIRICLILLLLGMIFGCAAGNSRKRATARAQEEEAAATPEDAEGGGSLSWEEKENQNSDR